MQAFNKQFSNFKLAIFSSQTRQYVEISRTKIKYLTFCLLEWWYPLVTFLGGQTSLNRPTSRYYYLCEANSITCFSDHGKSIIDQGEDDVWASVVSGVCTEFSIHQIIHNGVKCFRG